MKAPLLIVAFTLGLSAALVACGDAEEDVASQPTATALPSGITSGPVTATPSPAATIQACSEPPVGSRTLAPAAATPTAVHTDAIGKYTVSYPANWRICRDLSFEVTGSGIQFIGEDGLAHAKVYVYPNPKGLALEPWLQENDPIFLDQDRERDERLIAGARALYSPVDAEGLPRAESYIDSGSQIVFVSALKSEEFDILTTQLRFLEQ
jgi:hypothetical protein